MGSKEKNRLDTLATQAGQHSLLAPQNHLIKRIDRRKNVMNTKIKVVVNQAKQWLEAQRGTTSFDEGDELLEKFVELLEENTAKKQGANV